MIELYFVDTKRREDKVMLEKCGLPCRVCPVNALVKHKCEIPVLQGCLRVSLATHWPEQLVQHLHRYSGIESASAEYSS